MPYQFVKAAATHRTRALAHHECWPTEFGRYRMEGSWIDTDNKVWSEPGSLYGDFSTPDSSTTMQERAQ